MGGMGDVIAMRENVVIIRVRGVTAIIAMRGVEERQLGGVGGGSDPAGLQEMDVADEGTDRLRSRGKLRAVRKEEVAVGLEENHCLTTVQQMHLLPVKEVGVLCAYRPHEGIHPANCRLDRRQRSQTIINELI